MSANPSCEVCQQRVVCAQHDIFRESLSRIEMSMRDGFESMSRTFKEVAADLRDGAVTIGNLKTRVALMERVLFGAVALALSGLGVALFNLVVKG